MQHILNTRADPNVGDLLGHTPLHLAVRGEVVPIVQLLLERGARTDHLDNVSDCTYV